MSMCHSKLCLILILLKHIYSYLFRRFNQSTSVYDYTSIYNRQDTLLHVFLLITTANFTAHMQVSLSTHQGILWEKYKELAPREERVHHKLLLLIWMPGGHWNCDTSVEFERNQAWKKTHIKYFCVRRNWQSWISRTDQKLMHSLHYHSPTDGASVRLYTAWLNLKYTSNGLRTKKL